MRLVARSLVAGIVAAVLLMAASLSDPIASDEPTKPSTPNGARPVMGPTLKGSRIGASGCPTDASPLHRMTEPDTLGTTQTGNCST